MGSTSVLATSALVSNLLGNFRSWVLRPRVFRPRDLRPRVFRPLDRFPIQHVIDVINRNLFKFVSHDYGGFGQSSFLFEYNVRVLYKFEMLNYKFINKEVISTIFKFYLPCV